MAFGAGNGTMVVLSELREHLGIVSNDLMTQCTRDITGRELVLSAFFGSVGLWPHHVVTPDLEARADMNPHSGS
jgi:iron complex transport system ATP-binding protein